MAKGSQIIVTSDPKGRREECTVSGTPKPGTVMEQTSAAAVGGRFTFQASSLTAGAGRESAILLDDPMQGFVPTVAYVSGARGFLYYPVPGEELNMVILDVAGTADDKAIGDLLGIGTTGKLVANSAYVRPQFRLMETITDPVADTLAWVRFIGG